MLLYFCPVFLLFLTSTSLALILPPPPPSALPSPNEKPSFFYPSNGDLSEHLAAAELSFDFDSFDAAQSRLPPLRWDQVKQSLINDLESSENLDDGYQAFGKFFIGGGKIYDSPSKNKKASLSKGCFFTRLSAAALQMRTRELCALTFFAAAGFAWSILQDPRRTPRLRRLHHPSTDQTRRREPRVSPSRVPKVQ
ncbi:hypothetical protein BDY24DRAFT_190719 [Mrakia frigida]|uniref:uncharacterized protein n=1 Tax=Mrakia frigida TaxID=29902 RepID=UPI003FCC10E1